MESLTEELQTKTSDFLGGGVLVGNGLSIGGGACPVSPTANDSSTTSASSGSGSRFIDTVRKALISRVKNASTESVPQQLSNSKKGSQNESSPPSNRQSTSKVNGKRSVIEPSSPLGSPDLTNRRDSDRASPGNGSQDSSISTTDNQDSQGTVTTIQQDLHHQSAVESSSHRHSPVDKVDASHNKPTPNSSTIQRLTSENLGKGEATTKIVSESDDSSLNSELELDQAAYPDSDTGLESMSSAEAHERCTTKENTETDNLRVEVTRLKCDKLDLLRQNVVSIYIYIFFLMSSK